MPYAIAIGVDYGSFWRLNPHSLAIIAEGYNIALKRQFEHENAIAHLQGMYFVESLLATVGNMLSSKNTKKHDYPDKPYDLNLDGHKEDREQERQLELFKAQLTARMTNFNLSKEQG